MSASNPLYRVRTYYVGATGKDRETVSEPIPYDDAERERVRLSVLGYRAETEKVPELIAKRDAAAKRSSRKQLPRQADLFGSREQGLHGDGK